MNAQLPKYMSIKDFCAYSGYSRYQFLRLAKKAGISIKYLSDDWRSKMVDVQKALAAIEALPEATKKCQSICSSPQRTLPNKQKQKLPNKKSRAG